jgi:hypothetical protein
MNKRGYGDIHGVNNFYVDENIYCNSISNTVGVTILTVEQLKSQNQTLEKEVELLKKVYEAAKECVVDWQVWDELEESVKAYEESRKINNE